MSGSVLLEKVLSTFAVSRDITLDVMAEDFVAWIMALAYHIIARICLCGVWLWRGVGGVGGRGFPCEDGSHLIDAEEFVDGCMHLKGSASALNLAKLQRKVDGSFKKILARFDELEEGSNHHNGISHEEFDDTGKLPIQQFLSPWCLDF